MERRIDSLQKPEKSPDLISPFLPLTGLRCFYPMAGVGSGGAAYDLSGLARTLTYNGNPTYNYTTYLAPYIDLDGTGDYLDRADEAPFDILGTETIIASAVRGLTMGGYFWADTLTPNDYLISKSNSATNNRSYALYLSAGPTLNGFISLNGVAVTSQAASTTFDLNEWHFAVLRFVPSNSVDIYLDGAKDSNVAAIPASIFNSNTSFMIGGSNVNTNLLDGRAALCFLCAAALSDAHISSIFQQTRAAFGI